MSAELEALAEVDREGRVGRTTQQVGIPGAVVVIAAWAARLADIDLNPLADVEEMPADVVAAFMVIVAVLIARRMNRAPSPSDDLADLAAGAETPKPPRK